MMKRLVMMNRLDMFLMAVTVVVLLALPTRAQNADGTLHQHTQKPYAGEEAREVKALSEQETKSLLAGEGMGLAKAAELNSYPGPRHVLDMADALQLSDGQRAVTRRVYDAMHAEAVRLGRLIVDREKKLDAMFARGSIEEGALRRATREIALLQGSLRATHLRAHLEMKRILSPAQVRKYDQLRGYQEEGGAHKHEHHQGQR